MDIAMLGPSDMLHLRRLVPAVAHRGHRVHVVSMKPDPIPGATFERFAVPRFSVRRPYRWRRRWEMYLRSLFKRFDVVNVHFLSDWGITEETVKYGCLVARTYGSDVDPPPDSPSPEPSLLQARRLLLRCASKVVAPSRWLTQRIADFAGIDASEIDTIPDGVDLEMFAPRQTRRRNTRVVGYFKGFKPVYGPMIMVDAVPFVLARCPDVRFEMVGSAHLRDACRRRAETLGVNHALRWIDHQPHEAMPTLMSGWDVVAISSLKESLCVAALEAAAMELPVVATDVGGLREAVRHEETGLLVEPENPRALADALVTLLEDPERRRTMGIAGRRHVALHYEWNRYVDRSVELLQTAHRLIKTKGLLQHQI